MRSRGRWPDLVLVARPVLLEALPGKVGTKVPDKVETKLPFTRITRGPGSDDGITDTPLLDVETFAGSSEDAFSMAEDARQAMLGLPGRAVEGALVDTVRTAVGPVEADYGNPAVVRVVASYRVAFRKTFDRS